MILYFSGTGNSRYVAGRIGEIAGEAAESMDSYLKSGGKARLHAKSPWVIVSPVYAWQLPRVVQRFIKDAVVSGNTRVYFVLTCGGGVGNAAHYAKKLCARKGLKFMGLAEVVMPENYITMYEAPKPEVARDIIRRAEPEIDRIGALIRDGKPLPVLPVTAADRLKSSLVNALFYPLFVSAKGYRATDACVGCGKCAGLCPLDNIRMEEKRPVWGKDCTQCMACICGCPAEAVEYKNKTQGKTRYYLSGEGTVSDGKR